MNSLTVSEGSSAITPSNSKILKTDQATTIIAVTKEASKERIESLKMKKVQIFETNKLGRIDLHELLDELQSHGVNKVLVEGGGETRWGFFKEKLVDELFVWIMPYIWGGRRSPTLVDGEGFTKKDEAEYLKLKSIKTVDEILILWFSVNE